MWKLHHHEWVFILIFPDIQSKPRKVLLFLASATILVSKIDKPIILLILRALIPVLAGITSG